MPERESSDLVAQRISDAGPGARTISEAREEVRKAALTEIRKIRNEIEHYQTAEQRG
jgi:hypothetical protein